MNAMVCSSVSPKLHHQVLLTAGRLPRSRSRLLGLTFGSLALAMNGRLIQLTKSKPLGKRVKMISCGLDLVVVQERFCFQSLGH